MIKLKSTYQTKRVLTDNYYKTEYKKNEKSVTRYSCNKDADVELYVLYKENLI